MKRVLVTGGAGFLGSAVATRLLAEEDIEVIVSDRCETPEWMLDVAKEKPLFFKQGDLRDLTHAKTAADGCTHIIHLAAIVGGIANFHKLPYTLTEVNSALNNAIFRAAIESDIERFVYVSSSMVFERATVFPTPESHILDCPPPRSAYGFSKLAGEIYCQAAHDEFDLPFTICRPFNAFGSGEWPQPEPGIAHVVPDLIKKALTGDSPMQIFGSGEQTRTLTWMHDIADGIVCAAFHPAGLNEDFNISASEEHSVAQIAEIIWEKCGNDPAEFRLEHLPSFTVDVQRRWPSVEKARKLLGWEAQHRFEDAVVESIEWIRRNEQLEGKTAVAGSV